MAVLVSNPLPLVNMNPFPTDKVVCPFCNESFLAKNLKSHIRRKHDLTVRSSTPSQILNDYFNANFNEEQLAFIKAPVEDTTLIAPPGSGKSRSCIGKIEYLMKVQGWTNEQIMVVMFGKEVSNKFLESVKEKQNKFSNVKTIHSLAGSILSMLTQRTSSSQDTVVAAAERHLYNYDYQSFAQACAKYANIKCFIVDEIQDISAVQYDFIRMLANLIPNCALVMVGDPNQNIFQFQGGRSSFLLNHAPNNRMYLVRNYRSSQEIVNFVNQIRPWNHGPEMISASGLKQLMKPIWCTHLSREHALDKIVEDIRLNGHEDVAIIGPLKLNDKHGKVNKNCIGLNSVYDRLLQEQIPVIAAYDLHNDNNGISRKNTRFSEEKNAVTLLTIHTSKGLEFKHTYIIDCHFNTHKKKPSIKEYNEHQFLWYVAMTRAKETLKLHSICRDVTVYPYPRLFDCNPDTYIAEHNADFNRPDELPFDNDQIKTKLTYSISELLKKINLWDKRQLLHFQDNFDFVSKTQTPLWENVKCDLNNDVDPLYGTVCHFLMEVAYRVRHKKDDKPSFVQDINLELEATLIIPTNLEPALNDLRKRYGEALDNCSITVSRLRQDSSFFKGNEKKLVEYILNHKRIDDYVRPQHKSPLFWYDPDALYKWCHELESITYAADEVFRNIFNIALYKYQREYNLPYFIENEKKANELFNNIKGHLNHIYQYVHTSPEFVQDGWKFEVPSVHPNLNFTGRADAIDPEGIIVEFKFSSSNEFDFNYKLQSLLVFNNQYPKWDRHQCFRIFNIRKGISQNISFEVNRRWLLMEISKAIEQKLQNIYLLYDLETTGLDITSMDAIERHFIAPELNLVGSTGLIKPSKLPLDPYIEGLTGITSFELEKPNIDTLNSFKKEIQEFLEICEKPVLIAHGGGNFDHKYLCFREIVTPEMLVRFLDSKYLLRIMPSVDKSIDQDALVKQYERIMGKKWTGAVHRAVPDVQMMKEVFEKLGITKYIIQNIALRAKTFVPVTTFDLHQDDESYDDC